MRLPPFEVLISLSMYVAALIYAIYHAFQYGRSELLSLFFFDWHNLFSDFHIVSLGIDIPENENAFSEGWSFIGRRRDDYDTEWESFVENTRKYMFWYVYHVLLSEIVRQLVPHVIVFIFIFLSINRIYILTLIFER